MSFDNYFNQAWNDHATQTQKVADGFSAGKDLITSNDQLAKFANLVTHVMGEHLGKWSEGQNILKNLKSHSVFVAGSETDHAIERSLAVMSVGSNETITLDKYSVSDRARILAVTSSALSEKDPARAQILMTQALDVAQALGPKDPALRALAITGNNLACALEEKKMRSVSETELMVLAAQTAREFWEKAGGWLEVSRAEYRLAMTYLQAQDLNQAMKHAQLCLDLCRTNNADDLDLFFAFEAVGLIENARKNNAGLELALASARAHFEKLSADDQAWCEPSLKKLTGA